MCSGRNELKSAASDAKQSGTAISGREKCGGGKVGMERMTDAGWTQGGGEGGRGEEDGKRGEGKVKGW